APPARPRARQRQDAGNANTAIASAANGMSGVQSGTICTAVPANWMLVPAVVQAMRKSRAAAWRLATVWSTAQRSRAGNHEISTITIAQPATKRNAKPSTARVAAGGGSESAGRPPTVALNVGLRESWAAIVGS